MRVEGVWLGVGCLEDGLGEVRGRGDRLEVGFVGMDVLVGEVWIGEVEEEALEERVLERGGVMDEGEGGLSEEREGVLEEREGRVGLEVGTHCSVFDAEEGGGGTDRGLGSGEEATGTHCSVFNEFEEGGREVGGREVD